MTNKTLPLLNDGVAITDADLFLTRQGADTSDTKVTGTQLKEFMAGDFVLDSKYKKRVRRWFCNGAGTTTNYALGLTLSFTGAAAGVNNSAASIFTSKNRLEGRSAATANAAGAGRHAGLIVHRGSVANTGGFSWLFEGGNGDAALVATSANFVGFYFSNANISTVINPSSLLNVLGFGWDNGDANMQFFHNDNAGTASKIDLGATMPANTQSTDWYRHEIWCEPNASDVFYRLTNMSTGAVVSGSVSTDLPVNTLYLTIHGYYTNGVTALARAYHYGHMILVDNNG